jgi:hypothetical protein
MVTRLSGGLTPADGADPRTFPAIWNATATDIETAESEIDVLQTTVTSNGTAIVALQGSAVALGSAVVALGSAVDVVEADVDALQQDRVGVLTAGSNGVAISFATETPLITRSASAGTVTLTGSDYVAGVTRTVRIVAGGTAHPLVVPVDWKFVGSAVGTAIAANKTAIITATSFGTVATSVVAAYAVEA